MSDTRPLQNLVKYIARTWVDGESITRAKLQGEFDKVQSQLSALKEVFTDIQNHRAQNGSPAQNDIQGQIAYDTSTNRLNLDPDGSGCDEPIQRVIRVDTTAVSTTTTGTLITYSVPASTWKADGKTLVFTAWGTITGNNVKSIQSRLNSTVLETKSLVTHDYWKFTVKIARKSSANQTYNSVIVAATTGGATSSDSVSGTLTEDDTAALQFDINVSANGSGDTITQEGLMVELLN